MSESVGVLNGTRHEDPIARPRLRLAANVQRVGEQPADARDGAWCVQIDDVSQDPLALALRAREVERVVHVDVVFVELVVGHRAIGARIADDVERAGSSAADANDF